MVNSPLTWPYLLGGEALGGGTLDSHEIRQIRRHPPRKRAPCGFAYVPDTQNALQCVCRRCLSSHGLGQKVVRCPRSIGGVGGVWGCFGPIQISPLFEGAKMIMEINALMYCYVGTKFK